MISERIFLALLWLRRALHSRGFGVQSPSAYNFIRYVCTEHYPYYAYADLRRTYPHMSIARRRLLEFYFRLANRMQADTWWEAQEADPIVQHYVQAGCRRTKIRTGIGTDGVIRLSRCCAQEIAQCIDTAQASAVLIIEGIHRNRAARQAWKKVCADKRTGVTFDLYFCGVVFFDKHRPKQNYIVNF